MSAAKPATVPCPTCRREVPWTDSSTWRPFCSKRCRMIDLGAWLAEDRAIPAEPASPTDIEAAQADPTRLS